jgi:hypothetical protein
MWEWPDKRVWFFLGPTVALTVAFAAVPLDHLAGRYIELTLYLACAVLGISIGSLSIKDRFSLLRPSHTLDETPVLFWLDVAVGCFVFSGIAIWKIVQVLRNVF